VQKWSQRSSLKNKSKKESKFAKTFWRSKMTFWAMSSQVIKHGYNPEMKQQSAQWKITNSPKQKKFRQAKSKVKTLLLTFFYK
jgi:hypothetical protein